MEPLTKYMLMLYPHEELMKIILDISRQFNKDFPNSRTGGKPGIPLVSYKQQSVFEQKIILQLRDVSTELVPFKIELEDFGSLPTHTIYLQVKSRAPVYDLVKKIRKETQQLMKPDEENKPLFFTDSHITIAHSISPVHYDDAWLRFRHAHFAGRFIADTITLMKQENPQSAYRKIATFMLTGQEVINPQGSLF